MDSEYMNDNTQTHLEPRVARLETGLETLTKNVNDLTLSIRENNSTVSGKLDALSIAVTTAQAPRRTDWGVIISAIGLIIALGAAVLIPLNQTAKDNKQSIEKSSTEMADHMKLNLHPVGAALVQRLEDQIVAHAAMNDRVMKEHIERDIQTFDDLNKKCHMELNLVAKNLEQQLEAMNKHMTFFSEKLLVRVERLETRNLNIDDKNDDELRQWRSKASGLLTPAAVAPFRPIQRPVVPMVK